MPRVEHKQAVILYQQLLEAWNRRSADGFAELFERDGSAVGFDGSQMDGQEEITSSLRDVFANHQTAAYVAKVREARRMCPGVTLLRAVVGMVPPGKTELNPNVNAIQSLLIIERDGELKISLLQNTPAAFHGRPHLAEQLTEELKDVLRSGQVVSTG